MIDHFITCIVRVPVRDLTEIQRTARQLCERYHRDLETLDRLSAPETKPAVNRPRLRPASDYNEAGGVDRAKDGTEEWVSKSCTTCNKQYTVLRTEVPWRHLCRRCYYAKLKAKQARK